MRLYRTALLCILTLPVAACGLGYYAQAAKGHLALMREAVPIESLLDDPSLDNALRDRLILAESAVAFARDSLGLPDNGSYRKYVALDRSAVVWNVVAAPEFSLQPVAWCFPVAGCVTYRGYFDRADAVRFGDELTADGHDVFVGGAAAYSTLGRFRDPLLSTMLDGDPSSAIETIFHELAHQRFYIKDDTQYNESFATVVAREGMRRWFDARGEAEARRHWLTRQDDQEVRSDMLTQTRDALASLYDSGEEPAAMRTEKKRLLDDARSALGSRFPELNNASLAAYRAYDGLIPAFRGLLSACENDLDRFYMAVESIAERDAEERGAALSRYAPSASTEPGEESRYCPGG